MSIDRTAMTNMEPDEMKIEELLQKGELKLLGDEFSDDELISQLVSVLGSFYQRDTRVIGFTGEPASGKDTIVEHLESALITAGHPTGRMDSDAFNIGTREDRGEIVKTQDSLAVKNFDTAKEIIARIREGQAVKVPVYDDATGKALVRPIEEWRDVPAGLHFLIFSGDLQPFHDLDYSIYFHVPSSVRRMNRIQRDEISRPGYGDADAIGKDFDKRQTRQFYPHTLPVAEKADMLIIATPEDPQKPADKENNKYKYRIYQKQLSL